MIYDKVWLSNIYCSIIFVITSSYSKAYTKEENKKRTKKRTKKRKQLLAKQILTNKSFWKLNRETNNTIKKNNTLLELEKKSL